MLNAEHVTIRFGGITAVNDVSIHLERNKITALIGPNGAGKTTFFNCISGVYTPNEGTIVFEGQHIEGKKGYQICEAGLSRTYQVINLSWKMTALENILVGMHSNLKSTFWQSLFHTKFQRELHVSAGRSPCAGPQYHRAVSQGSSSVRSRGSAESNGQAFGPVRRALF